MMQRLKLYLPWILLSILLMFFVVYSLLSDGYYGGTDNVAHYLFSHYAFRHPELFLHSWARPVYTIFSAPFARFGFPGIRLFNVLAGLATAMLCYRIAGLLGIRHPWLAIILVCFTPLYFLMIPTALTEIVFSLVFALTCFLFLRGNFIASAIVISFLPFARSEGYIFLPVFFLIFLYFRRYKAIPFLATGMIVLTLIGLPHYKDVLWLIDQFPYPVFGHHPTYTQKGSLWHFLEGRKEILGFPMEMLFIAGTIVIIRGCFSREKSVRDRAFLLGMLALAPFLIYLAFHSLLYWKALGGSMGLGRVMAAMLPMAAVVCLKGVEGLEEVFSFSRTGRYIFLGAVLILVVRAGVAGAPFPYHPGPEDACITKASEWFRKSPYQKRKLYFTDITTSMQLGLDYFETSPPECCLMKECATLDTIPPGSIIIWDAHFGSNESAIPPDSILRHKNLRLIQMFRPPETWITFGGYLYECFVMKALPPGQQADNYAIRDSLITVEEDRRVLKNLYFTSFEPDSTHKDTAKLSAKIALTGKYSFVMDSRTEFGPGYDQKVSAFPGPAKNRGIRVTVYVNMPEIRTDLNTLMVISFENEHKSYSYTAVNLDELRLKPNQWERISISAPFPGFRSPDDMMKTYIWNPGKQVFYIDDMKTDLVKMP